MFLVSGLIRLALRLLLLGMGLVVAAGLLCLLLAFASVWGLRALWAKLTGHPVTPWVMRVDPRTGWSQFAQRGQAQSKPAESAGRMRTVHDDDVVDVEVKGLK